MTDASMFDPQSFLEATLDAPTERRPPLPVERDYTAVIGEVKSHVWSKEGKSGIRWEVPLLIEIPADLQGDVGGLQNVTLSDSIFIDVTPQGTIDNAPGRNSGLRRYREATNMNNPGDSFSARKMQGVAVKVKIKHELYMEQIQERIAGVAKL